MLDQQILSTIMADSAFPTEYFVHKVVQLLELIRHDDQNYEPEERIRHLTYAYQAAQAHFAQPHVRRMLTVKPKKLEAALRTITGMVVYCWVAARQVQGLRRVVFATKEYRGVGVQTM